MIERHRPSSCAARNGFIDRRSASIHEARQIPFRHQRKRRVDRSREPGGWPIAPSLLAKEIMPHIWRLSGQLYEGDYVLYKPTVIG